MIWLLWHIFILFEAGLHWFVIDFIGYDPTPDGEKTLRHAVVIFLRLAIYSMLWLELGIKHDAEFWMFTLGCLFTHLLFFAPLLNAFRDKPLHYLGNGFTDKILAWLPFQARVWFLLVLSVGMIYGYYNTDLL